ncbi:MAG: hypothetical protein LBK71_09490 [Verrucomicrobiales bacterium]|nr:hypothetical protein [Verrucomicrobiales bacterium]
MKFLKFMLAVFLLPALFASGWCLCRLAWQYVENWAAVPWMNLAVFALGFSAMTWVYLLLPRWNWLYVFGHETTHVLAVLMSGGKVAEFKVSATGGQVTADKLSAWIALAPYIVPFYPLVTGLAWCGARWLWPAPLARWELVFVIFWGAAWAFHLCFTVSLLKTDQPDFTSQGWFFSIVVILLCNLLIISALLWLWLAPGAWRQGAWELWDCAARSYGFCGEQIRRLYGLAF